MDGLNQAAPAAALHSTVTIRPATQDDAADLLDMLREMHAESPLVFPPINENKTMMRIVHCIASGLVLIAEDDATGDLAGSLAIEKGNDWYADSLFFTDLWFFVRRGYRRGTGAAVKLVNAVKAVLDEHQPEAALRMGVFYGEDIERKDRFFEHHGFTKAGCYFVKGM